MDIFLPERRKLEGMIEQQKRKRSIQIILRVHIVQCEEEIVAFRGSVWKIN